MLHVAILMCRFGAKVASNGEKKTQFGGHKIVFLFFTSLLCTEIWD